MNSFYEHSIPTPSGDPFSTADLRGKVVLIVNTATGCGFTPQYKQLEQLYEQYHEQGLEIIDIPCNQFAGQTPGTDEEIHEFCALKYHTQFPQMKKSDVNGANELSVYTFLKSRQGFKGFGKGPKAMAMDVMMKAIDRNYKSSPDIKWNFTKFLVSRSGEVTARFEPTDSMGQLEEEIKKLLGN